MSTPKIVGLSVAALLLVGVVFFGALYLGRNQGQQVEVTRVVTEEVQAELPEGYQADPLAIAISEANILNRQLAEKLATITTQQAALNTAIEENRAVDEISTRQAELNDLIAQAEALATQVAGANNNVNGLAEVAMTATPNSPSISTGENANSNNDNGDSANTNANTNGDDEEESTNPSGYNTVAIWDHNMAPGKFGPQCIAEYRLTNYAEFNPTFHVGHATDNNFGDSIDLFIDKNEVFFDASALYAAIKAQMPEGGTVLVVDDRIMGQVIGDLSEALGADYDVNGYNNCNEIMSFANGQ